MKVLLSGGGTLGSVTPLLALVEELREKLSGQSLEFLWLGTRIGPEEELVKKYNIPFRAILGGKVRRYFSWRNFMDPLFMGIGFFQSWGIIYGFRPEITLSAGSFVSVPVVWASWLLRVPALIHQEDLKKGLANHLMIPFARCITVTFRESLRDFPPQKRVLTGNPIRQEILEGNREEAIKLFNLEYNLPTVLVLGGGTGALGLNKIVVEALPELVKFSQVIHLTGEGKGEPVMSNETRYHPYEFLANEMKEAYAAADLVISRAGLATLTELALLEKPTLVVPLAGTHQEANAQFFYKNNAIKKIDECDLNARMLVSFIKELLADEAELENLKRNISKMMIQDGRARVVEEISKIVK